ncbi:MAG: hypothetical protein NC916_02855 [Candidatus Omnitrophica bacterium]|nr:hypothetical protein [Candidatus Omnitrophota bacterium]
MTFLFIGSDTLSKDVQLKKIRQQFLSKDTEQFNLDILFAKELTLKTLQERLLSLPVKSQKRVVVIKEAHSLKEEIKEFILKYVKAPFKQVVLILDLIQENRRDAFVNSLQKYSQTIFFAQTRPPDAFTLARSIELKKCDNALKILNQLLKAGIRPECILGGLRYAWEKGNMALPQMRRTFRLLLNCDIEIKTGRLKPDFALEKLVINLSR